MTKKIIILCVIGIMSGLISAHAAESPSAIPVIAGNAADEVRFSCTFEGPAAVAKGAVPLVCTAFGEFERDDQLGSVPRRDHDNFDHLTVICGNTVLYSDGVFAGFPSNSTTELRSIVPNVAIITVRSLTPGVFTGPLGAILRLDIPGTPQALLTGVCHLNGRYHDGAPGLDLEME